MLNLPSDEFPGHIAIVGGGRWARVVAGVLCEVLPPQTSLTLCSPGHQEGWLDWLAGRKSLQSRKIKTLASFEQLLLDDDIELIMIIRAARDNAPTAIAALNAGKSVFIEKPFAMNFQQANAVQAAIKPGNFAVTGLVFLFALNLHRFVEHIKNFDELHEIRINWHDRKSETRHNESKSYDPSLNGLIDVFPHIWSLLRLLNPEGKLTALGVNAKAGGRHIQLELKLGSAKVYVDICRDASARRREIAVKSSNNEAAVDFTTEPGEAFVNNIAVDIAKGYSSPLACEINSFVSQATSPGPVDFGIEQFCQLDRAIEAIELVDKLLSDIRQQQTSQIVYGMRSGASNVDKHAASYALREMVLDRIWNNQYNKIFVPDIDQNDPHIWKSVHAWLLNGRQNKNVPSVILDDPVFKEMKQQISDPMDRVFAEE